MTGPGRTLKIVLALLAALAVSGLAVGTASAGSTTAVTCAPTTLGGGFSDSHCVNQVTDGASFYHSPFTGSTGITVANSGSVEFKALIAGTQVSIVCTSEFGKGTIENLEGGGPVEMSTIGTMELNFSGCTLGLPGCTVSGGGFTTKPLSFATGGLLMAVRVGPTTPSVLAEVVVDGCNTPAFNRTWLIEGTATFVPHGTTLNSTHAEVTSQGTLTVNGFKAGLASSFIISGPSGSGIAFTT